jgi:hypothetical protein
MGKLERAIQVLAVAAVVTGMIDFALGARAAALLGAELSADALRDPVLNSQIRFFGATWMGYGAFTYLASTDLEKYSALLTWVVAAVALGGVGRVIGLIELAPPAPPIYALIVIEIVVVPLILVWKRASARKPRRVLPSS